MGRFEKSAIVVALLLSFQPLPSSAFPTQDSKDTGAITGRVLFDGKPAPGVVVLAVSYGSDPSKALEQMLKPPTPLKALTDGDGRYRLEGVPSGKYSVLPSAPTSASAESGKEVTVAGAGTVEDIDFSLTGGGVITGKITDSEGQPVIGEEISLKFVDPSKPGSPSPRPGGGRMYVTDDRGIYRIFALPPGRYIVSAGATSNPVSSLLAKRPRRIQTYYPGVTEETKAKPVDVAAGADASGVDISLGIADKGFTVSGRVLTVETGAPIASAMIAYQSRAQENPSDAPQRSNSSDMPSGITTSNAKGEFRIDSVTPGKYSVEIESLGVLTGGSEFYADPVTFEVQSANIDKLEIKVHLGASITGVVAVEGGVDASTSDTTIPLMLIASVSEPGTRGGGNAMGRVAADGTFRIGGLKAGKASFSVPYGTKKFAVVRVEHDGAIQLDGIEVQANAQITGVRVVVVPATCIIRGRVTVQGGTLPAGSEISVWVRAFNGDSNNSRRISVSDSQGNFEIDDVAPGDYEIEATANIQGSGGSRRVSVKQSVTVTSSSPAQTTLVLDISVKGSDK
jgi:protocatechuate 3,4-dioxygenase beta subunit